MPELLLHYIWQRKAFLAFPQTTTDGRSVEVLDVGMYNTNAGPDFIAAKIRIDGQLWVGNVEIHILSSDWYRHGHDTDPAYDSVLLHVVRRADKEVTNSRGEVLTQCELRYPQDEQMLNSLIIDHIALCSDRLQQDNTLLTPNWKQALLADRLHKKNKAINQLLKITDNNWREAFYITLAHNFGFHTNSLPFELLAKSLPLSILLRHRDSLFSLEALLFGQSGLLNEQTATDDYSQRLLREYRFLRTKYSLEPIEGHLWKLLRMRPQNFPHIRIAQFAVLLSQSEFLFSRLMDEADIARLRTCFQVSASEYWSTHYRFGKVSPTNGAALGKSAIDLLLINTVVPYKFAFSHGKKSFNQTDSINLLRQIPAEKNSIIDKWKLLGFTIKNAAESQTFIHLYQNYCLREQCLNCEVGWQIFSVNSPSTKSFSIDNK